LQEEQNPRQRGLGDDDERVKPRLKGLLIPVSKLDPDSQSRRRG
jgi:hypothetical protein